MTILNVSLDRDRLRIVMDTVALRSTTRTPATFCNKFFLLPHIDGVICGTGVREFVFGWAAYVNAELLLADIVHLDEIAPDALRQRWEAFGARAGDLTSTAYHFGYSRTDNRFHGYAYRSTENFASIEFPIGASFTKPGLVGGSHLENFPGDFIEAAKKQKEDDDARPQMERVGVGGKLISVEMGMHDGAIYSLVRPVFMFPTFADDYSAALRDIELANQKDLI